MNGAPTNLPNVPAKEIRRRKLLNAMLLGTAACTIMLLVALALTTLLALVGYPAEARRLTLVAVAILVAIALIYTIGRLISNQLASALLVLLLIVVSAIADEPVNVADGRGMLTFSIPIVMASVLIRPWASFLAAGLSSTAIAIVGMVIVKQPVPSIPGMLVFFLLALIAWLSARSLERALEKLRTSNRLLRQSEERYRLHFENVSDVVYSLDPQLRVLDVSPSVERLLGYESQELIGRPFQNLGVLAPESMEQALSDAMRVCDGEQIASSVYQVITRDGTKKWAEVSGAPLIRDGEVSALISVARDVTERRRIERELRQQERLAAVGQLAGGIAHDFNNILAAIILYAKIGLRRSDLPAATRNAFQTILDESHRAADLVQQILDFSRSATMSTEPLSLVDTVRETLSLLRRTIAEDVHINTRLTSDPCTVQADATRIHQVLMNLALNAKDAMPDGGEWRIEVERVTVACEEESPLPEMPPGHWAPLVVSDSGTGLSDEAREHLFEPFFTTKEEGEGTGLGLAQVYGIVKQHEGFIDVDTAPDQGTTFTIFLPLVEDQVQQEATRAGKSALKKRGQTVLIVEDAGQLRHALQVGLETAGYQVLTAANGGEALDTLAAQDVSLVLTDVVMPEMGGEALLRRLRSDDPQLKIIAMTGHLVDTDVQELQTAGFDAELPKPFSMGELTETAHHVLDS